MGGLDRVRFRDFAGAAGLKQLWGEWESLAAGLARPAFFHMPQWYDAYLAHLDSSPESVVFVGAYEGETLCAVFPLRRGRRSLLGVPFRSVELPEHPHMAVGDFVVPRREEAPELLAGLTRHVCGGAPWTMLCLQEALEGSGVAATLDAATGFPIFRTATDACLSLPIEPFEIMQERFSTKLKANLRNRAKRLAKLGSPDFVPARTAAELEAAYERFLDVEASGWKGKAGTAIKQDARLTALYRRLAGSFGPLGRCHVNRLTVDGKTVAAQFCLVTGGTCFQLKFGYEEQYASLGPGDLLLEACFRWYATHPEEGVRTFNFLSGAAMFDKWQPAREEVRTYYLFNRGPAAALAGALLRLKRRLRKSRASATAAGEPAGEDAS